MTSRPCRSFSGTGISIPRYGMLTFGSLNTATLTWQATISLLLSFLYHSKIVLIETWILPEIFVKFGDQTP
jgi:hypothetical protein